MSRYIPDLRSIFPTIKGVTETSLRNKVERWTSDKLNNCVYRPKKQPKDPIKKDKNTQKRLAKRAERRSAIEKGLSAMNTIAALELEIQQLKRKNYDFLEYPKYSTGMKSDFYRTREWRTLRWKVINNSKGCCSICGRNNRKHGVILHVDHIKPRSKFPELELDINNLQVLCEECNIGKGARTQTF